MTVGPKEELTFAAAVVARLNPREWSIFLGALKKHTDQVRENCISSPLDQLPVAQGRAQNARELLALFETCVAAADQIQTRRENQYVSHGKQV